MEAGSHVWGKLLRAAQQQPPPTGMMLRAPTLGSSHSQISIPLCAWDRLHSALVPHPITSHASHKSVTLVVVR
jgi:hypothetical protein